MPGYVVLSRIARAPLRRCLATSLAASRRAFKSGSLCTPKGVGTQITKMSQAFRSDSFDVGKNVLPMKDPRDPGGMLSATESP